MARSGTGLSSLLKSLGIEKAVSFCGWVSHAEVLSGCDLRMLWCFHRFATSVQAWSLKRSLVAPYRSLPTSAGRAISSIQRWGTRYL